MIDWYNKYFTFDQEISQNRIKEINKNQTISWSVRICSARKQEARFVYPKPTNLINSIMTNIGNSPLASSMQLLTVSNKATKPQDGFVFRPMTGVDKDGETIRVMDMETELRNNYFVLFFFSMDFKVDSSEVLSFKEHLEEFTKNHCEIVGVTSDSSLAVKRWISKDVSRGGFGGPVGFPILTDNDLSLSMSLGVARDCGSPARATFIIDWTGRVRYMMVHRSDIGRSVKEILRLVQAFRHSDLTGEALASGWIPGGEVIPTDFTKKVEYFINKFGHGNNEETKDEKSKEEDVTQVSTIEEEAEKVSTKSENKASNSTNSKATLADVHKSPDVEDGKVSVDSFKSAVISPDEAAESKSPLKAAGSKTPSPSAASVKSAVKSPGADAKSEAKSPLKPDESRTPSADSIKSAVKSPGADATYDVKPYDTRF